MANNNIGIQAVGCYVPSKRLNTLKMGPRLDAKEEFITTKLGFLSLAQKGNQEATSDLCVNAYENLKSKVDSNIDVGCLIVVTQNPDSGGIPHTSAIVHHKLGLQKRIACCDISLGCTGFVHGSSMITAFMRENEIENGLLFTADPYSMIIDPNARDTVMLFGDGATCTLFSHSPKFTLGRSRFVTDSKFHKAIKTADDPNRTLSMIGHEVFRFVAKNVPREVRDCLEENSLSIEQIDQFLIHQGSKFVVETLAMALKINPEKMKFEAGEIGNTVSSSIPIMLADVLKQPQLPKKLLAAGFGVGLSSFVTVLNRVGEKENL